jgi:hypothetical protein
MKKILTVALALAVAFAVAVPTVKWATCTYTTTPGYGQRGITVASCNSTTEAAPTVVTEGRSLAGATAVTLKVKASGNMTAGGQFQAYLWSAHSNQWYRAPRFDHTITAAATNEAFDTLLVPIPDGRIDWRPYGAGANNTLLEMQTWGR